MPLIDLLLEDLQRYTPTPDAPPDLGAFWQRTLAEAAKEPLKVQLQRVTDYPVPGLVVSRLTYGSWCRTRVAASFMAWRALDGSQHGSSITAAAVTRANHSTTSAERTGLRGAGDGRARPGRRH
jgi:Acetyl xylan esterase (AXE1)